MASSEIPHLLTASGEQLTDGIANEPMIPDGRKGFYTVVRMETSNAFFDCGTNSGGSNTNVRCFVFKGL